MISNPISVQGTTTQLLPMKASGDGLTTVIKLPHGLSSIPTYYNAISTSDDSANISRLGADSTFIMVYYNIAPPLGVDNLLYNVSIKS